MNDVDVVEREERPMRELTLSVLQREAYDIAVSRGQWPRGCRASVAVPSVLATVARRAIGEEATELAAALSRLGASGPLDPVADELADVVIVCASIAEALGVNLEQAVANKMRVNAGRAKRHREEDDDRPGAGEDPEASPAESDCPRCGDTLVSRRGERTDYACGTIVLRRGANTRVIETALCLYRQLEQAE